MKLQAEHGTAGRQWKSRKKWNNRHKIEQLAEDEISVREYM
jgi:hypothetical protein